MALTPLPFLFFKVEGQSMKIADLIRELQKLPPDGDVEVGVRVLGKNLELLGQGPLKIVYWNSLKRSVLIKGEGIVTI